MIMITDSMGRGMKLGTVKDFVASAMKGFMKKVNRRPWCQDLPADYPALM